MGIGACVLLLILLLANFPFALALGTYKDYVYDQDYSAPSAPANRTELSCEFFSRSNTSCQVMALAPKSSRDQILFAIIRMQSPEENQDWVRYWNSRLPISNYYEEAGDGAYGENGSIRNAWFRLIDIYPSLFDPRDNYTYLPKQALISTKQSISMVVPTAKGAGICAQQYEISGYDYEVKKQAGDYSTKSYILPVERILAPGQKANLTISFSALAGYSASISRMKTERKCDAFGECATTQVCAPNGTASSTDTLSFGRDFPIKRYPSNFAYENRLLVPQRGYAQGFVKIEAPSDFLYWEMRIKGQTMRIQRNDLKFAVRGGSWPIITLQLESTPGRQQSLRVESINESDEDGVYRADIHYKMFVEAPDVGPSDCSFVLRTPFGTHSVENACDSNAVRSVITLTSEDAAAGYSTVVAKVADPLGMPLEGVDVEFSGGISAQKRATDARGMANITVGKREFTQTIAAKVAGGAEGGQSNAIAYVPGMGSGENRSIDVPKIAGAAAPILLIIIAVSALVAIFMKRRSSWAFWAVASFLALAALLPPAYAANGTGATGIQATLDACKNYDFDNAVRHFGECAESYRLATEFDSMRTTVGTLIANIAPLVVANPDITPYRGAYNSMAQIALALLRVAWAFNSLYLILNVFNPVKRNQALMQFIWLLVFVPFVYLSFGIIQNVLTLVNAISTWVAGPGSASALLNANQSVEFISENYEMLKLILPFLNLTYLILLARYILVIGTLLFFPFSLLLFFTSATRGFGRAAMTVTFAAMGLGVVNAVLMLIYGILSKSADPLLSSTFSTTFFSASFLIFFGFVNLFGLAVAFLSGILFIGQNRPEA